MKIEKKCWPEYFEEVLAGEKNFELRLADWQCQAGDILVLREYDKEAKEYTGRQIEKEVGYVLKTKECNIFPEEEVEKYGYQVIGFKEEMDSRLRGNDKEKRLGLNKKYKLYLLKIYASKRES